MDNELKPGKKALRLPVPGHINCERRRAAAPVVTVLSYPQMMMLECTCCGVPDYVLACEVGTGVFYPAQYLMPLWEQDQDLPGRQSKQNKAPPQLAGLHCVTAGAKEHHER